MKKVCFIVNHHVVIYNFRKEIVRRFLSDGVEVHILSPAGPGVDKLIDDGAIWHDVPVDRRGTSVSGDIKLYKNYKKILADIKPDFVLCYTIKPNLYGGMAAKKLKIPFVVTITGLSAGLENGGKTAFVIKKLYRYVLKGVQRIFFQNQSNMDFFLKNNLTYGKERLVPGSGVNLEEFNYSEMPGGPVKFVYVARVMREKGIDEYLLAAKYIKARYPETEFLICGFLEDDYKEILSIAENEGTVKYLGMVENINEVLQKVHCIVHPSFYPEGISNAILEAITTGRAVITTDMPGCRDLCIDGENGYLVPIQNFEAVALAMEKFLNLSNEEKILMGKRGHELAAGKFDRQIVIDAVLEEFNKAIC